MPYTPLTRPVSDEALLDMIARSRQAAQMRGRVPTTLEVIGSTLGSFGQIMQQQQQAKVKASAPVYGKIDIGEGRQAWIKHDPLTNTTVPIFQAPDPPLVFGSDQMVWDRETNQWIWQAPIKVGPQDRLIDPSTGLVMTEAEIPIEMVETPQYIIFTKAFTKDGSLKVEVNRVKKIDIGDDEFVKISSEGIIEFYKKSAPDRVIRQLLSEDVAKSSAAEMLTAQATVKAGTLAEIRNEWEKDVAFLNAHTKALEARIEKLKVVGTIEAELEIIELTKKRDANVHKVAMLKEKREEKRLTIDERYKIGLLGVAEGELVRKTNLDLSHEELEKLRIRQKDDELASLDAYRKGQRLEGIAKIEQLDRVLEFESSKFDTLHNFNVKQTKFLNSLKERVEGRADERLALETSVELWTKSRGEAYLALAQLSEKNKDLLGWAETALGMEKNRLTGQASETARLSVEYQRELGIINANLDQAKQELLEWEKGMLVPAQVAKMEAETRALLEGEPADLAKQRLELLKMAKSLADPGNTFMTIIDRDVKAQIFRDTMAFYNDFLQTEMDYSPEAAARFSTPVTVWKTLSGVPLEITGERPEEITPRMQEQFGRGIPFEQAIPPVGAAPPTAPTAPPTAIPPAAKAPKRTAQDWIKVFKMLPNEEVIKALQNEMTKRGLWDGAIDGIWTKELERKFATAYRRGKIELRRRGE